MDCRATSTRSTGAVRSCWWSRKLSRMSRRARLRTTAPPIRLAVITPSREEACAGSRRQFAIRQPDTSRSPPCRVRRKSRPCLMRAARQNRRRRGVSSEVGPTLFSSFHASAHWALNIPAPGRPPAYTGVSRLRPTRRRLARVARPLLLEFRFRNPCCRLRRIFDGWYCRFINQFSSVPASRVPEDLPSGNTPFTEPERITANPGVSSDSIGLDSIRAHS